MNLVLGLDTGCGVRCYRYGSSNASRFPILDAHRNHPGHRYFNHCGHLRVLTFSKCRELRSDRNVCFELLLVAVHEHEFFWQESYNHARTVNG